MKLITGLLVGATVLLSGAASAQFYSQASVSGTVLSYGPRGFMLAGPDGNYGIEVTSMTLITDSWNTIMATGQGSVQPGDIVTATGYPTSQWIMQASQVVVRNATPSYPAYGGYGGTIAPGTGIIRVPFVPIQQGVNNFNTLPTPQNNTFNPFPVPSSRMPVQSFRR